MSDTSTDYTMTAGELPAVRAWISFQNSYGQGMKQVSATDVNDYLAHMQSLADAYPAVQNPKIKGWLEQYFSIMTATDEVAEMDLVWQYLGFAVNNAIEPPDAEAYDPGGSVDTWVSYWNVFAISKNYSWQTPWTGSDKYCVWFTTLRVPVAPPAWNSKVAGILSRWGGNPPANFIQPGATIQSRGDVMSFETSVLQNWKNFTAIVASTAPVWQAQSSTLTAMLQQPTLDAQGYLLLLHLLIALGTSNPQDRQTAQKVVNAPTNSMEYPNDTFINHLVYFILTYFIDPVGDYGYNNSQLQGLVNDTRGIIVSTDPGSLAIKQSLSTHLKILQSDPSYPLQDPYNPTFGFNTRQSDILEALDAARTSVTQLSAQLTV